MNRDLSKFEPPKAKAEPDGHTKELFGIPVKFEKDSVEKLREMCTIPDDVKEKLVDIYNYMAKERAGKIVLQFETGIKMICEIDETEWKNPPKINLLEDVKAEVERKED